MVILFFQTLAYNMENVLRLKCVGSSTSLNIIKKCHLAIHTIHRPHFVVKMTPPGLWNGLLFRAGTIVFALLQVLHRKLSMTAQMLERKLLFRVIKIFERTQADMEVKQTWYTSRTREKCLYFAKTKQITTET